MSNSIATGNHPGTTVGSTMEVNQAAHGLTVLDGIYHNGTDWVKAKADNGSTLAQFVISKVIDVDNFEATKFGTIRIDGHGKIVGEYYFLSETVAGTATSIEPLTGFSSPLFYVTDIDHVNINVYRPHGIDEIESDLNSLSDVTTTSPVNGEALVFNSSSSEWENSGQVSTNTTDIGTNTTDIADLETLSGSPGATNHGTFTGNIIPDNTTTKPALQSLETAIEQRPNDYLLINGNFRVNQRGSLPKAAAVNLTYYSDRWKHRQSVAVSTASLETTLQPSQLSGSKSYKVLCTSGATGYMGGEQVVEDSSLYLGKTLTASVWVKSNSNNSTITIVGGGVGGATTSSPHSGLGGWELLTVTTLISSGDLRVQVIQNSVINSGHYIEFTGAKLELGSIATEFIADSYRDSLRKCQRYYQRLEHTSGSYNEPIYGLYNGPSQLFITHRLIVPMRIPPTRTNADISFFDIEPFDVAPTSINNYNITETLITMWVADPGTRVAGYAGTLTMDVAGGWMAFDAEYY